MNQRIYKYSLNITDYQILQLPKGAKILSAQFQWDRLCIWALVDKEAPTHSRQIFIFGTGNPIPDNIPVNELSFVGTVQQSVGAYILVWHIFESLNPMPEL